MAGIKTLPIRCWEDLFIKKSSELLYCSNRVYRRTASFSRSSVLVHGWWRALLNFCSKGVVFIVSKHPKIRVSLKLSCWTPRKGRRTLAIIRKHFLLFWFYAYFLVGIDTQQICSRIHWHFWELHFRRKGNGTFDMQRMKKKMSPICQSHVLYCTNTRFSVAP